MKIETKYNRGDDLWTMYENVPHCLRITEVQIIITERIVINYRFEVPKFFFYRKETEVFKTKEALIASL